MDKKTLLLLAGVGGLAAVFFLRPQNNAAASDKGAYQMLTNPWGFGLMSPYRPIDYNTGWGAPAPIPAAPVPVSEPYPGFQDLRVARGRIPPVWHPPGGVDSIPSSMVPSQINLSVPANIGPAVIQSPAVRGAFYSNY